MKILCRDILGNEHYIEENKFILRSSVYGIFIKNETVLLVKDSTSNTWEIPGGGVEDEESEIDALTREFREETGLKPIKTGKLLKQWGEHFFDLNSKQAWLSTRKFYFIESATTNKLLTTGNNDDIAAAKFIKFSELGSMNINKNIYKLIVDTINQLSSPDKTSQDL